MNAPDKLPPETRQPVSSHLWDTLAVLICPCHLPILVVVLAGTTAGAFFGEHWGVAALALTGLLVLAATRLLHAFRGGSRRVRSPPDGRRSSWCRWRRADSLACITSRWSTCTIIGSLARKR